MRGGGNSRENPSPIWHLWSRRRQTTRATGCNSRSTNKARQTVLQIVRYVRKMLKKRIDGRRLPQNIGEQVILLGTIGKKSSNGRNIELTATDGVLVNVTLPEPIDGNPEGYIEVQGTVQSKSTLACSSYILFPSSMTEKFKAEQYNDLMVILNVLGPRKWSISADDTGL